MTKNRRYLISAVIVAACVCVALGPLALMPPRPGVTKANFDRIQEGMTRAEVDTTFGKQGLAVESNQPQDCLLDWRGDDGATATVVFEEDAVIQAFWTNSTETFTDKLRRWLHLPRPAPSPIYPPPPLTP